jgi:hypothetical protein
MLVTRAARGFVFVFDIVYHERPLIPTFLSGLMINVMKIVIVGLIV